jgi:flagellar basal body rod protein FlgG
MPEIIDQIDTSITALMEEFNIITHNLANTNTTGYKRICNEFAKLLMDQQDNMEAELSGEITLNSTYDFSQGGMVETGRTLDFALHGKGFFVLETPEGPLYTRNGTFYTNQNGQIVDSEGRTVAGEAGPITIPANVALSQVYVTADGSISVGDTNIGKFRIVNFPDNEDKLESVGTSCFMMTDEQVVPVAAENVVVKQGYQEASNVKMVDELVDMMMVTRLYEANMKFVSAQMQNSSSLIGVASG